MNNTDFKPGQRVPRGVFWVHHYAHRVSHLVAIEAGTFPPCNKCGTRVRYEAALQDEAGLIWEDADFGSKKAS